ncbi:hypothetical protein [Paenibacillus cymbidii]|uniref:hypothetical protein n=1 Tax=Paenibacillus cymbidii TaxID=1639034 RepID=UPI0010808FA5|nr:hypothetical protein [Paenibacillus cymbidii]
MNRKKRYPLLQLLLVSALLFALAPSVMADDASEAIAEPEAIGSVSLGGGSYVELKDAVVAPGNGDGTLLFTLAFHNGGDQEMQAIDYWVRLAGSGGKSYAVSLTQADKDKNRIPAQSALDLHFYAKVSAGAKLSDFTFTVIRWDFSVYNYERKLGAIAVPADYSTLTPAGTKRIVTIDGTPLRWSASKFDTTAIDDTTLAVVRLDVENAGYRSVTMPAYSYAIETAEGYVYPLDASALKDAAVAPLAGQSYRLTATVPAKIEPTGWKLIVTRNDEALKVQAPVASFVLPEPGQGGAATPPGESRTIDLASSDTTLAVAVGRKVVDTNADSLLVSVVITLENTGLKPAAVPNYGYSIRTPEGYQYPLTAAGAKDMTIAPKEKKELQLNAAIPNAVKDEEWKLVLTVEDAAAKLTVPVAMFELPEGSGDAAAGSSETITLDAGGNKLAAAIARVSMGKSDAGNWVNVFFRIANQGTKAAAVPNYSFRLVTEGGFAYPQTSPALNNVTLSPKASRETQVSFALPAEAGVAGLRLQVLPPATDGVDERFLVPVATFQMPKATVSDVSLGVDYPFQNKAGSYTAKLNALQRLPLDEADILTAEVTIGNKGSASLPIPDLQAYFMLDGGVKVPAELYKLDQAIAVPAASGINVVFYAKMPYATTFTDLKLVLQEKKDADTADTVVEFRHNADLLALPVVARGDSYKMNGTGRSASVGARELRSYSGVSGTLAYVELTLTNLEKRLAAAGKLFGYFRSPDNTYYPLAITSPSGKIGPGSQAVVALWGELPKGVQPAQLELLLGEALPGAADGGQAGAYVRGALLQLPAESTASQPMDKLRVAPYTVAIRNIHSLPQVNSFSYSFDYTLAKEDGPLPELTVPHRLVLELTDSQGRKYERSFDLGKAAGAEQTLAVGSGNASFTINDADPNFFNKTMLAQDYTLKVYDEFAGYRRQLATQSYKWMNMGID